MQIMNANVNNLRFRNPYKNSLHQKLGVGVGVGSRKFSSKCKNITVTLRMRHSAHFSYP